MSLPKPPVILSLPAPPSRRSLYWLPVIVSFPSLPFIETSPVTKLSELVIVKLLKLRVSL
ncbi:MAG: hypothetical protein EAZ77_17475 [Nostocales cyanobacterium]|nr:MAG: hypothetical protein EAZ77_17475 [Nostocales cyanobacterium]